MSRHRTHTPRSQRAHRRIRPYRQASVRSCRVLRRPCTSSCPARPAASASARTARPSRQTSRKGCYSRPSRSACPLPGTSRRRTHTPRSQRTHRRIHPYRQASVRSCRALRRPCTWSCPARPAASASARAALPSRRTTRIRRYKSPSRSAARSRQTPAVHR